MSRALLTGLNVSAGQFAHWAEVNTNKFTESGRVVITDSLGVTERLEHGVGLHDLILQITLKCIHFGICISA